MKIQEFLMKQPAVKKYAAQHTAPLIKYESQVPERYVDEWLKTAPTPEELAFFYVGVVGRKPEDMPWLLASLERHKGLEVPQVGGILSREYWEAWSMDHLVEIMDERTNFIHGWV